MRVLLRRHRSSCNKIPHLKPRSFVRAIVEIAKRSSIFTPNQNCGCIFSSLSFPLSLNDMRKPHTTMSHVLTVVANWPEQLLVMEVNGGNVAEKVDFAYNLFEQKVPVDQVFTANEMIDTIAITRGRGTEGVVTRWGVTRLPRKTHRGLRKVLSAFQPSLFLTYGASHAVASLAARSEKVYTESPPFAFFECKS